MPYAARRLHPVAFITPCQPTLRAHRTGWTGMGAIDALFDIEREIKRRSVPT